MRINISTFRVAISAVTLQVVPDILFQDSPYHAIRDVNLILCVMVAQLPQMMRLVL